MVSGPRLPGVLVALFGAVVELLGLWVVVNQFRNAPTPFRAQSAPESISGFVLGVVIAALGSGLLLLGLRMSRR